MGIGVETDSVFDAELVAMCILRGACALACEEPGTGRIGDGCKTLSDIFGSVCGARFATVNGAAGEVGAPGELT